MQVLLLIFDGKFLFETADESVDQIKLHFSYKVFFDAVLKKNGLSAILNTCLL